MRAFIEAITSLDAKAANGSGVSMKVEDFRHIVIELDTALSAALTLKLQGSIANDEPTWGSASSAINPWGYVQMSDISDGSTVDGATGLVLTGTDVHKILESNTNGLKWVNLIISGYAAGNLTALIKAFNDCG